MLCWDEELFCIMICSHSCSCHRRSHHVARRCKVMQTQLDFTGLSCIRCGRSCSNMPSLHIGECLCLIICVACRLEMRCHWAPGRHQILRNKTCRPMRAPQSFP